jgi:hypothetical protein
MTSPRIYVYKITFDEVPHYYYGVHKEKRFDEYYMGSPVTHKNYWERYTPNKEIIKTFDYTDNGWLEAQEFEKSLIAPVYNIDPYCLNENCGGVLSLEVLRESARKLAIKIRENGTGLFGMTSEEKSEAGKKGAQTNRENGTGLFGISRKERIENAKKYGKLGGKACYERGLGTHAIPLAERIEKGIGIYSLTKEERSEISKKAGKANFQNSVGIFSLTDKEMIENSKKGGKSASSQKWKCTVTGHISNAGPLTRYQNKKGIDISNRIKVDGPRKWEITFEDGRVIVTYQTLKEWAKENGYKYSNIQNVRNGASRHKDIIKIDSL